MPRDMTRAALIADLSDLLQLDCDALGNYRLAIGLLRDPRHRRTLSAFLADHERHVDELTRLIRALGGVPVPLPHMPSGLLKLGFQAASAIGDDRLVLLAFRGNERQVRDRYARAAAAGYPPPVDALVQANAADEARHFDWVTRVLEGRGLGEGTPLGGGMAAISQLHAGTADLLEDAGRSGLRSAYRLLRPAG